MSIDGIQLYERPVFQTLDSNQEISVGISNFAMATKAKGSATVCLHVESYG